MPAPALVSVPLPLITPDNVPAVACVIFRAPPLVVIFPEPLTEPVVATKVRPKVFEVEVISAFRAILRFAVRVNVAAAPAVFAMADDTVMSPEPDAPAPAPVLFAVVIDTLVPAFKLVTIVLAAVVLIV